MPRRHGHAHDGGQEEKTFDKLAEFINRTMTAALRFAPSAHTEAFWPKEDAQPLVDLMLTHVRKIPTKERTNQEALDALEFADRLATLRPAPAAKKARAELGELGVRVIRIGTLPERMAYDKEVIVVEKGKAVEFIFENIDLMPHNIVFARPGSLEFLGKLASRISDPVFARGHGAQSDKVLLERIAAAIRRSSGWVGRAPGVYLTCTYPGLMRKWASSSTTSTSLANRKLSREESAQIRIRSEGSPAGWSGSTRNWRLMSN